MHNMINAFVLVIITVSTFAQIPFLEKCPIVEVVQNFNVEKYMGKWYEQKKYPFIFEIGGKCITAEYSLNPNGTVRVFNRQLNVLTGHPNSIEGNARLDSETGEAKLLVRFPSVPVQVDAPYWVLSTDYNRYAVVWSCSELGPLSARIAWILTRDQNPSKEIMDEAHEVLDSQHISKSFLTETHQKDCPAN